ncbi:glycosyltransferase family 4 protein [Flavobacteriaceae bacterium TP-CH-4]|uniref:Glycosyltransferase family 4 protein n=1 Tax=Pelagihabitans pacificus TaxID=2696054 RepID=A0A967EF63_9FLAO|nr:glycosyltransferase family 4 protein [Pelagihabitans pacificus]NHF61068.1 glycosyltransferase family 4 protein [Pelagihabitans pacificus]
MKPKLIRITTIPASLGGLLRGQLRYMSDHFEVIGIASATGGANATEIDVLENVGVQQNSRVIPVEMTRKITPWKDLKATWQLYKIFKSEKPYIVHTHTPKAGTLGMMAAFLARVPHRLHTIAGLPLLEAKGAKRVLLDTVEKMTYACATGLYPNSFGLKDILIRSKYTKASKLKVIANGSSNGVDTSLYDPGLFDQKTKNDLKSELGIKSTDFVFIFVGRLVTDKGLNELAKAFKLINSEFENTKLLLVGSPEAELDPLLPETELILKNNKGIISVGSQRNVRPYYAIADMLTFPSYREGFPNVVMEAGSMGLPSIVSDINGCNEIILEGKNGYIVPVKNVDTLYDRMKEAYLLAKKGKSLEMNAIRELIISRYSRSMVWEEILKEYQRLPNKDKNHPDQ